MSPDASSGETGASESVVVPRRSAFDLVEGLQLGHAAAALQRLGVLAAMDRFRTATALAEQFSLDAAMLAASLEFLAARSDLVIKRGKRFRVAVGYDPAARFLLDLYAGAFAGNAVALSSLLRRSDKAGAAVDRARHASAFLHVPAGAETLPADLLRRLGKRAVLDLGCGPANLLRAMALSDPDFRGWGIDGNPAMCRNARRRLREAGVAGRVRILRGDAGAPTASLPEAVRAAVDAVVAGDLINEWCADGALEAVARLRRLRNEFPGRLLLIGDYYGRLGHTGRGEDPETLLHDYVQAISGQGIPPPDFRAWRTLYRAAGLRPVHCIEDSASSRFIHLLRL